MITQILANEVGEIKTDLPNLIGDSNTHIAGVLQDEKEGTRDDERV